MFCFQSYFPPSPPVDRSGLTSSPEASWLAAINNNISNQKLYNNIVKEIINGVIRAGSWLVLSLVGIIISLQFSHFDVVLRFCMELGIFLLVCWVEGRGSRGHWEGTGHWGGRGCWGGREHYGGTEHGEGQGWGVEEESREEEALSMCSAG